MNTIGITKHTHGLVVDTVIGEGRLFSTGSAGWYANGKADIDGNKYQVAMQAVVIGSKGVADEAFAGALGKAQLSTLATPKNFKTGSTGFYATWKQSINGFDCQCSATITLIGSSPAAQGKAEERAAAAQKRADEAARKVAERQAAIAALKASIKA